MRIVHLAPLIEPLGPRAPGGAEQVVYELAGRQASRYEVSIIAAKGSQVPPGVKHIDLDIAPGCLIPVSTGGEQRASEAAVIAAEERVFRPVLHFLRENAFDLIHNHAFDLPALFGLPAGAPAVHTVHLPPLVPRIREAFKSAKERIRNCAAVSRSLADSYARTCGCRLEVIYNGIDVQDVPFSPKPGRGLLWAGRISPEKGLPVALRTARVCGENLTVIGRVYDALHFQHDVRPLLCGQNQYLGHLPHEQVLAHMRAASALLMPVLWEEPFGMVAIEALASGTPVIAFGRGALPEIITHGETGFLADSEEQFAGFARQALDLDRTTCRSRVEAMFSLEACTRAYEKFYQDACGSRCGK